jgi:YVTN family beta-propeller protein
MKIAVIVGTAALVLAGSWVAWANLAGSGGGRPLAAAGPQAIASEGKLPAAEQPGGFMHASPGLAFVINSNEASISLIDVGTRQEIRRIPVLREPHHMALTPDHRLLLVGDTAGNEMLFLNPTTGNVEKRMTISDPYQFGFSPDGKWLVVNGLLRNQIDIYDAATMQLASRVPV